jgi:hypothetical protein
MYIGSTNLYLDIIKYNTNVQPSWFTTEKYENCENFYQNVVVSHSPQKLFHKKK